jgi:hypothetical protein
MDRNLQFDMWSIGDFISHQGSPLVVAACSKPARDMSIRTKEQIATGYWFGRSHIQARLITMLAHSTHDKGIDVRIATSCASEISNAKHLHRNSLIF